MLCSTARAARVAACAKEVRFNTKEDAGCYPDTQQTLAPQGIQIEKGDARLLGVYAKYSHWRLGFIRLDRPFGPIIK